MNKITYFGHNSFLFQGEVNLLTDPFIKGNPLAQHIDVSTIKADYILLTHGHGDHISDVADICRNNNSKIIAMVEVASWFANQELDTHGLNFGGTYKFSESVNAKYVQAHHSSSMPDGSYGGNPGSYIIKYGDKTIFLAGDTSLHYDMKMFGELYRFDLLILPIGGNYTMDHDDAVIAAKYLNCKQVIGCHYDTFPVIEIDKIVAKHAFSQEAMDLHLLEIGENFEL